MKQTTLLVRSIGIQALEQEAELPTAHSTGGRLRGKLSPGTIQMIIYS